MDQIKGLDKTVFDMFNVMRTSVTPAMKTHANGEDTVGGANTFQNLITTSSSSSFFGVSD